MNRWKQLGIINPRSLIDTRLQLHHALQIPVGAAISYLKPKDDDSHTSLEWMEQHGALVTYALGKKSYRCGLEFKHGYLIILDSKLNCIKRKELNGHSIEELVNWLKQELKVLGFDIDRFTMKKHYEIPDSDLTEKGIFSTGHTEAYNEFSNYFSNADTVLSRVEKNYEKLSTPVRCWPHHFDIATLIVLEDADNPEDMKTIGVGMSPGDTMYEDPYFYVSPYPKPDQPDKLSLPEFKKGGHWHAGGGWFGAVLTGSELVKMKAEDEQYEAALNYIETSLHFIRSLIDTKR